MILLSRSWSTDVKKRVLAVCSCVFYAAWDYRYLVLLLAVSIIDYFCAARIDETENTVSRRRWLLLSIVSNVGILAYFKYTNFFIGNVNWFLPAGEKIHLLDILLPAGISFYTFKSMSYTIDVYRREIQPCRSQIDYTTFITFFPELIAGPIVRASVFLPQMQRSIGPNWNRLYVGGSLFLLGLTKKMVIADRVSQIADPMFQAPETFSGLSLMCGVLAYTIQIYCDFSGYSDMAIGTAKMIGYDLPENFNMPYLSRSVTEFWRRWHITLSSWLRDYLYIPLGGNRKGKGRTYLNLMITMLLGGLWHGASWNFVLWGALHGVALAVHKWLLDVTGRRSLLPAPIAWATTFLFASLCWIPFRSPDWGSTATIFRKIFTLEGGATWYPVTLLWISLFMIAGHVVGAHIETKWKAGELPLPKVTRFFSLAFERDPISQWYVKLGTRTIAGSFLVFFWLLFVFFFGSTDTSPFIYFQF